MSDTNGDRELEQAVAFLRRRIGRHLLELRLVRRDQGIVLQGRTHSYYVKQLAQHTAMQELRLSVAANEIEVHPDRPLGDAGGSDIG
jgi:hypothetical protein